MHKDNICVSGYKTGHVQGIAVDKERKYMYYSFTTCLVKSDLDGNVVGSVKGLAGHLGCIAYNYRDGKVYGSLEYKHDRIGQGILQRLDRKTEVTDGFYIAIFDVEKIDRMDMDAEKDGVMTAVHLQDVVDDYHTPGYRYGCSGIDGTTFAPLPGAAADSKQYLYVAYGIYGETNRTDNDHQIILRYDVENWEQYAAALDQNDMHRNGPAPEERYFVLTGNTTFGVQNLEYDPVTRRMLLAVYPGRKENYPNYPMFAVDMTAPAATGPLQGLQEEGSTLTLAACALTDEATGISGYNFPYGATGMATLNDGCFYFSRDFKDENGFGTNVGLYRFDPAAGFEKV